MTTNEEQKKLEQEAEAVRAKEIVRIERTAFADNVLSIASSPKWRKRRPKHFCEPCNLKGAPYGTDRRGKQRWRCPNCKKFIRFCRRSLLASFLTPDLKIQIIVHMLAEGLGILAAGRITRVNKNTVCKINRVVGEMCEVFLQGRIVGVRASDVEVDECWTYVFKKEYSKTELEKKNHQVGSAWVYLALDRETKLILAYHVGRRTLKSASEFMYKLRAATVGNLTVYSDGFQPYPSAVYSAFMYDNKLESLPEVIDRPSVVIKNNGYEGPLHASESIDYTRACTNQIERFNGTLRGGLRRMARRSQSFSKTWRGLETGLAIFLAYYNFCRVHSSLSLTVGGKTVRRTPAMAAGLTRHPYSIRDLILEIQRFRDQQQRVRGDELSVGNFAVEGEHEGTVGVNVA